MSAAAKLYDELVQVGGDLSVKDGKLVVAAPRAFLTEALRAELKALKPELMAIVSRKSEPSASPGRRDEPDEPCKCGRAIFWREGNGPWRCLGCDAPQDWDRLAETLALPFRDRGPRGVIEIARSAAITLLNEAGARLFETDGAATVGLHPEQDSQEVRAAVRVLGVKRIIHLDDPQCPERYRRISR